MALVAAMDSTPVANKLTVFAASMISAAGAAIFLILPLLIGTATEALNLASDQAGLIASSYFLGYMLICLSAVFWIHLVNWQLVSVSGFILLCAGLAISATVPVYTVILGGMFASGCGGGILFGLALCVIAETEDPDRYFGVKIVAEQVLGAALLFSLPLLITEGGGFRTLTLVTAVVLGGIGLVTFWIPAKGGRKTTTEAATLRAYSAIPIWIGMVSLLIYFGGLSAVWAFVERNADGNGIDAITIGQALSFGVIGGGVGAFIAAISGDRFGRVRPLLFSALIIAAALWIYNGSFSGVTFAIVTFLFSGAWNYSLAYQLGIVASVDTSGRYVVLMSAALASGAVLGPAAAGFLINDDGFGKVHAMAIIAVAIATTAYIYLVSVEQAAVPDGPTPSKLRG